MYTKYLRQIQKLDMAERGALFTAILCYASGEQIPDMDAATDMAFSFIQEQIDRDNAAYADKCQKRRDAGKLGGRPKEGDFEENLEKAKKANGFSEKQNKAKKANGFFEKQNNPDNEYEYDNDNDKDIINNLAIAKSMFERLWKLYPNKKGKGQVSDTQKKRLLAIGEDKLVKAIERYSFELQKDADWRKAQYGSTFFNSGYVDYLDENYVPGKAAKMIKTSKPQNSFNNFNQRSYDYDELERDMLKSSPTP